MLLGRGRRGTVAREVLRVVGDPILLRPWRHEWPILLRLRQSWMNAPTRHRCRPSCGCCFWDESETWSPNQMPRFMRFEGRGRGPRPRSQDTLHVYIKKRTNTTFDSKWVHCWVNIFRGPKKRANGEKNRKRFPPTVGKNLLCFKHPFTLDDDGDTDSNCRRKHPFTFDDDGDTVAAK